MSWYVHVSGFSGSEEAAVGIAEVCIVKIVTIAAKTVKTVNIVLGGGVCEMPGRLGLEADRGWFDG
jgi:hypothetical protein